MLQEGGPENHEFISSGDKDWKTVLEKMYKAVTVIAFKGAGVEGLYDQNAQS